MWDGFADSDDVSVSDGKCVIKRVVVSVRHELWEWHINVLYVIVDELERECIVVADVNGICVCIRDAVCVSFDVFKRVVNVFEFVDFFNERELVCDAVALI